MSTLRVSLRATLVTLVFTGALYPLVATGLAHALFPRQASGGFVAGPRGGVVGAELLAQPFKRAGYLQPRPSAAGDAGWDAMASGGSNLGPTSKKLHERVLAEAERLRRENPDAHGPVPAELVSASASGLDPHVSPEGAQWQAPRIAKARGVDVSRVVAALEAATEGRDLGVLGEPRVNVLMTNLALDAQFGAPPPAPVR